MQRAHPIILPDGGALFFSPIKDARKQVLFVERDAANRDHSFVEHLIRSLNAHRISVIQYEYPHISMQRRLFSVGICPSRPHWLRRCVQFLRLPMHMRCWKIIIPSIRQKIESVEFRSKCLKNAVAHLSDPSLTLIGRSAGGRIATLIADEANVAQLICLAYPFRFPGAAPESARYQHLEHLRTPTLIIQGDADEYGGRDILKNYHFPSNILINIIKADHDFALSDPQWQELIGTMCDFIDNPATVPLVARRQMV